MQRKKTMSKQTRTESEYIESRDKKIWRSPTYSELEVYQTN